MKVINLSGDEHVLRIKSSLLAIKQGLLATEYRHTKMYRQALARRFTVCYFAFLNYLVARVELYEESPAYSGMEQIIQRCRRLNLFMLSDERMVIRMSMLYAALTYYDEGFDLASDELLMEIPEMVAFLERFVSIHGVFTITRHPVQARL